MHLWHQSVFLLLLAISTLAIDPTQPHVPENQNPKNAIPGVNTAVLDHIRQSNDGDLSIRKKAAGHIVQLVVENTAQIFDSSDDASLIKIMESLRALIYHYSLPNDIPTLISRLSHDKLVDLQFAAITADSVKVFDDLVSHVKIHASQILVDWVRSAKTTAPNFFGSIYICQLSGCRPCPFYSIYGFSVTKLGRHRQILA